jgi:hypothetical protein
MTSLEETLAEIQKAIEEMKGADYSQTLGVLLRRKQVICAALAAPEQTWPDPSEQADHDARRRAA